MSAQDLVLLFHPLLLVPVLVWIGYRYLPFVQEAGRPRILFLILLCAGMVLVQVSRDGRWAYPLSTWTMYSQADPTPEFWRVMMVGDEWEAHVPWRRVAPVRSARAFHRHVELRARELAFRRLADQTDEVRAAEAELATLLREVVAGLDERRGIEPFRALRVDRCEVDVRRLTSAADVGCETVLQVPVDAP